MKNIVIPQTEKTPEINIDVAKSHVRIHGICTPENPHAFFNPVTEVILKSLDMEKLQIEIYLEYFNTGTSKTLLNILLEISKRITNPESRIVKWIYEKGDDELKEAGEILQDISKMNFEFEEMTRG